MMNPDDLQIITNALAIKQTVSATSIRPIPSAGFFARYSPPA
jgi:hypothetical protein